MATSDTANLIHISIACLDPVSCVACDNHKPLP